MTCRTSDSNRITKLLTSYDCQFHWLICKKRLIFVILMVMTWILLLTLVSLVSLRLENVIMNYYLILELIMLKLCGLIV